VDVFLYDVKPIEAIFNNYSRNSYTGRRK